ncbi:MAG: tRNA pseudouridine(13) synthase TruD, partial [Candidatus Helarchaeales archaeon]
KVGSPPVIRNHGNFCFLLKKRGIDTLTALNFIEKELNIKAGQIGYSGMKDKQAMTTQVITIRPEQRVTFKKEYKFDRMELHFLGFAKKNLKIGDLLGNAFTITVRDVELECEEIKNRIKCIFNAIQSFGGMMNYFGSQRFGDVRPNTHLIGKYLIQGDIQSAIDEYLLTIYPREHEEDKIARMRLRKEHDYEEALKYFPNRLNFEKKIMEALLKNERNPEKALLAIPRRLQTIFIFAFQSFLFNRFISRRRELDISFTEAIEGDVIILADEHGLPSNVNYVVTSKNMERLNELLKNQKAFISDPLVGYETNVTKEYLHQILDEEGISPQDFKLDDFPHLSSRGKLRPILSRPLKLSIKELSADELNPSKNKVKLSFNLMKGSYATIFMREIMKEDK